METQFINEPLEKKPNKCRAYNCTPNIKSTGFTHLMKLVLQGKTTSEKEDLYYLINDNMDDINEQNDAGLTALMIACRNSNTYSSVEIVKILLDNQNLDINKQDKEGHTALMMACRYGNTDSNIDTIKLLLDHPNIDINKQDKDGLTALMMACIYYDTSSNIETVKLLLYHPKIDINIKNTKWNCNALEISCLYVKIEPIKLLSDLKNVDNDSCSAEIGSSVNMSCGKTKGKDTIEIIKLLLKNTDVNINRQYGAQGNTPLIEASRFGLTEVAEMLLNYRGIDINKQNNDGKTALMMACVNYSYHQDITFFDLLLNHPNIDINKKDNNGRTALALLFKLGKSTLYSEWYVAIIKLFLNHKELDINIQNNEGETILMELSKDDSVDPKIEIVELLLSHKSIDVNKKNNVGYTALMLLIRNRNRIFQIMTARMLLGHKKLNINEQDNEGFTYLMMMCNHEENEDRTTVAKLILSHPDIDLNKKNNRDMQVTKIIDHNYNNFCTKIPELILCHPRLSIDIDTLQTLLNNRNNERYVEILIPKIFNPLIFNYDFITKILVISGDKYNIIKYCYLHTNVKKNIIKDIKNHKEQLYCKPHNIIALCSEIDFELKFKTREEVFKKLDKKLKFIFDIKNEFDMVNKTLFYL